MTTTTTTTTDVVVAERLAVPLREQLDAGLDVELLEELAARPVVRAGRRVRRLHLTAETLTVLAGALARVEAATAATLRAGHHRSACAALHDLNAVRASLRAVAAAQRTIT